MPVADKLQDIARRIPSVRDRLETEEATKTALVMPFLQALGYDVFDPTEVVPEFTADVGIKRGEKVDYAVHADGVPILLFECKPCGAKLNRYSSQLYRYFSVTAARVAVLTDGVEYRFYTDLAAPNMLDERPFMVLDLSSPDADVIDRVALMAKGRFDLGAILECASTLKDSTELRLALEQVLTTPSDAFIKLLADPLHDGRMTQSVLERFRPLVAAAVDDYIAERVEARLRTALDQNRTPKAPPSAKQVADPGDDSDAKGEPDVETTMEELEAFFIVKALLRTEVDPERITSRDVRTYFGVLLDDNNRKPICRFWFNRQQRYLGLFDAEKRETRLPIESAQDIFKHVEPLRESLRHALT
ncbi:MAG: type I restriction endonuclease [Phycisphaerales bacterium JB041]